MYDDDFEERWDDAIEEAKEVYDDWDDIVDCAKEIIKEENYNDHCNFYYNYIKSDKWKKVRSNVLKRDEQMCQDCMKTWAEEVHHQSYEYLGTGGIQEENSCISLCMECHIKRHKK